MNGYNFTERIRKVLAMARGEAARRQQGYVGVEHILLAMVKEGEGIGCDVLRKLDVSLGALSRDLEATMSAGAERATVSDLPYASPAKKALELSMAEARELGHSYVGTEHLVLGVLRGGDGVAAAALADAGVGLEKARAALLGVIGQSAPQPQAARPRRPRCIDCRFEMEPFAIELLSAEREPIEAYCCPKCGVLRMFAPPA